MYYDPNYLTIYDGQKIVAKMNSAKYAAPHFHGPLFAAAKELMDACKSFVASADASLMDQDEDEQRYAEIGREIVEQARAAIAKARPAS